VEAREIDLYDVRVETFDVHGRPNITEAGVRMTHIPTGIVVESVERQSRHKNHRRALELLTEAVNNPARFTPTPSDKWPDSVTEYPVRSVPVEEPPSRE
jgi:protein subunit release factor A